MSVDSRAELRRAMMRAAVGICKTPLRGGVGDVRMTTDGQSIAQAEDPCKPRARLGLNAHGSFRVPNTLFDHPRFGELRKGSKLPVLLALLAHRNSQTGIAWPAQQTIADLLGMGLRTVGVAVSWLREGIGPFIATERRWIADGMRLVYRFPFIDNPDSSAEGCASLDQLKRRGLRVSEAQTDADSSADSRDSSAAGCAGEAQGAAHKHTNNRRREHTTTTQAAAAAEDVVVVEAADREKMDLLTAAGLTVESVRLHVSQHSLDYLRRIIPYCEQKAKTNPAGLILRALQADHEWKIPQAKAKQGSQTPEQKAEARQQYLWVLYSAALDYATEDDRALILPHYPTPRALVEADPLSDDELDAAPLDVLFALRKHVQAREKCSNAEP